MSDLREAGASPSSLKTLVKHEVIEIVEEPAEQAVPQMKPRTTLESLFTSRQKEALREIRASVEERRFQVALLHGVTGSGKPRCIWRPCSRCWPQGVARFCWCRRSD